MNKEKKRVSIFLECIIFLVLVLGITIILNKFSKNTYTNIVEVNALKDVDEENESYIKKIKKEYGISIVYGEDSRNLAESVNASTEFSDDDINEELNYISEEFKKYPKCVFDIFKSKKYPLKIVLVDKFDNNNIALTSKSNLNDFKIYLSNNSKFKKAVHHEMYHVLEYYMADTHKFLYKEWGKLNPQGFNYVASTKLLNNTYVYMKQEEDVDNIRIYEEDIANPYFVTLYSKTTEREDRAEIFSEMMLLTKKTQYLKDGQNILKKALYIDETIKECITNEEFYYSKYLK